MTKYFFNCSRAVLFLVLLGSFSAYAQNSKVTGTVTDESGVPLLGVNVLEKGTRNGVSTDFDGKFEITLLNSPAELAISYIGFKDKLVTATASDNVTITLSEDASELSEVVVIGYGTVKKRDVIGAVGSVGSDKIDQRAPTTALEGLQGRIAGVQIVTSSGEPGASSRIKIRGTSTFGEGTDPLYIVDGQPFDNIDFLNPVDIESLDVLKDGASAAIYGSKGANGVVLITTKRGKEGKAEFNVDYVTTYGTLANKVPVANAGQYIEYQALRNGNLPGTGDIFNTTFQDDIDHQAAITRPAIKSRVNVSLRGGNEKATYYWSAGFLDQEGIIVNTDFNRLSSKLNLDLKPTSWLTSNTSITLISDIANTQGIEGRGTGEIFKQAVNKRPFQRLFELDGTLITRQNGGEQVALSDLLLRERRRNEYTANFFQGFTFGLTKSLSFRANIGANFNFEKFSEFTPGTLDRNGNPEARERTDLDTDWVQENVLTWAPTFENDKHNLNIIAGASVQVYNEENSDIRSLRGTNENGSDNFPTDRIRTLNGTDEFNGDTGTRREEHSLASFFGRASYNYDGKYLFSATLRRDGSSRFGPNNRYGNFPAAQVGWRFSDDLFKGSDIVTNGMLRGGWAITGNERIRNYESQTRYALNNNGGSFAYNGETGIGITAIGDPNLKWEETEQFAAGIDLGFLNNRVTLSVDYYTKTTTDLLQELDLPRELAVSSFRTNSGSVENKGFEIAASATLIQTEDFSWSASGNISFNKNKVLDLGGEDERFIDNFWRLRPGESIGNFFGYKQVSIFAFDESNAFDENDNQLQLQSGFQSGDTPSYTLNGQAYNGPVIQKTFDGNVLRGGDLNFADTRDENGEFDGNIDDSDRQTIGNGLPDFFGGFSTEFTYKNLSLSAFFDYSYGNDLFREFDFGRNTGRFNGVNPSAVAVERAWRQQGDDLGYPAFRRSTNDNRNGPNSFYINDGSFVKLRNVRLGYLLPNDISEKLGMRRFSLYIAGNNLVTWTNYEGYDPEQSDSNNALEVGRDDLQFPRQREILIGLNVTF